MMLQQMQKTVSVKQWVTINNELRWNGNEKITMYFKELLTNFIGIEENKENFHHVDEHLTNTFKIT